ncbi:MAG: hypothetical protein P8177_07855, partial [Gemmatimonadota bacterium]
MNPRNTRNCVDPFRVDREDARIRVLERERDDERRGQRGQERHQHGEPLPRPERSQDPGEGGPGDVPEVRRHGQSAERSASLVLRGDVRQVRAGNGHVAARHAVEGPGEEEDGQRERQRERAQDARLHLRQRNRGEGQRHHEEAPGRQRPDLAQEQDLAPADAIRPAPEDRRPGQLEGRVGRGKEAVDHRIAAQPRHQEHEELEAQQPGHVRDPEDLPGRQLRRAEPLVALLLVAAQQVAHVDPFRVDREDARIRVLERERDDERRGQRGQERHQHGEPL